MAGHAILEEHGGPGSGHGSTSSNSFTPKGTPPKGSDTSPVGRPPGPVEVGVAEGVQRRGADGLDAGVEGFEGGQGFAARSTSTRLQASSIQGVATVAEGTPPARAVPARAGPATGALGTLLLVRTRDLTTPALIVQRELLEGNLATMSRSLPGRRLRPHVKAHKCTALAARQADLGHTAFTCSTMAEMEGMARAGLGDDLLLANEVVDATRLGALVRAAHG